MALAKVLVAGLLVLVAACGADSPDQQADPTRSGASATTPPPTAADGSNVSACGDANCEVAIRSGTVIPVPESTGIQELNVAKVSGDRIVLTGYSTSGGVSSTCSGTLCLIDLENNGFTVTLGDASQTDLNGASISVESITKDTAIITIQPAG